MSFRDFIGNNRIKQEQPKKEKTVMNNMSYKKVTRPAMQMAPQRRKQVEQCDIYAESQTMLDTLNEKLQQILYRFGMRGLEQVDQAIIDVCESMMAGDENGQFTRASKRKSSVSESVSKRTRQTQKPATPQSFIDLAAAAVSQMPQMDDISEHLPPQMAETTSVYNEPSAQTHIVDSECAVPISQPDTSSEYYDNLDPNSLDPDAIEAMLKSQNNCVGMMDPNILSVAGQAAKGK